MEALSPCALFCHRKVRNLDTQCPCPLLHGGLTKLCYWWIAELAVETSCPQQAVCSSALP